MTRQSPADTPRDPRFTPPGAHPAEAGTTPPGHAWAHAGADLRADSPDPPAAPRDESKGAGPDEGLAARGHAAGLRVLDVARRHPVGTALTAAGVAMLLAPRVERDDARAALARAREGAAGPGRRLQSGLAAAETRAGRESARLRQRLGEMRAAVEDGTEELSAEARERIVAARMRTIAARESALDHADRLAERARDAARSGAGQARDSVRAHPLLAGTLAVAAGAALGAALPRTRTEDRRLGALSDRLTREAEAIYTRERALLGAAARGAWTEAQRMAAEAAETAHSRVPDGAAAADRAEEGLRDAAGRIVDGARRGPGA